MNKSINPVVAALVLIYFLGFLVIYYLIGQQWLAFDRFGLAKAIDQDRFMVQYGKQLLSVDEKFNISPALSIEQFNQRSFVGDFDYFSNGDILIYLNSPSFVHAGGKQDTETGKSGFYRCSVKPVQCEIFNAKVSINNTFRLEITDKNQIYISDTTAHKLWFLNEQGEILSEKEGFKYPNQMVLRGNNLLVADTNHHAIKVLNASENAFAKEIHHIAVDLPYSDWKNTLLKNRHHWPVNFQWVNNQYWVLVADNGLSNARLAVFNANGIFLRELKLPEGADPISITQHRGKVLVFDLGLYQVYQFSPDNDSFEVVPFDWDNNPIYEAAQEVKKLKEYQYYCIWLFVVSVFAGFIVAIVDFIRNKDSNSSSKNKPLEKLSDIPEEGIWLDVNSLHKKLARAMPIIIMLMIPLIILANELINSYIPFLAIAIFILMMSIMAIPIYKMAHWRLGIFSDRIILLDHKNNKYVQEFNSILWNKTGFVVDSFVVNFQEKNRDGLFPHNDLVKYLVPVLRPENKIGLFAMFKYQWNSPEMLLKVSTLLSLSSVFLLVFFF